jgi:hypothetical protein
MEKVEIRENKKIRKYPRNDKYGVYCGDVEHVEIQDISKVDDRIKYKDIKCDSCYRSYQRCHCGNWTNPEDRE